jgi:hypothetical protein
MEFKMSEIRVLKKKQTIFFSILLYNRFRHPIQIAFIKKFFIAHLIIYNSDETKLQ